MVADSLNYGVIADPWAAEGYQAALRRQSESGCYAPAPGSTLGTMVNCPGPDCHQYKRWPIPRWRGYRTATAMISSRRPRRAYRTASPAGATNIKVSSVEGFSAGQKILIDSGANLEGAIIATVGTAGATTVRNATDVGATVLPAGNVTGFRKGEAITIDSGANAETAVVSSIRVFGGGTITVAAPLAQAHAAGVQISGSGINLTKLERNLARTHASGAQISNDLPTPGA